MNDQEYLKRCFGEEMGELAFELTVDYTVQCNHAYTIVSAFGTRPELCRAIADQAMQLQSKGLPLGDAVHLCIKLSRSAITVQRFP